jgi:RNA polymerase sigma-70 factor, ECF subfamily
MTELGELTILLRRVNGGDASATEEFMDLVYAELKRLAARFLNNEQGYHTLQPTALVHEAFMRLAGPDKIDFTDRNHFFAVAAQIMRRLLVDHGRRQRSQKRGGGKPMPITQEHLLLASRPSSTLQELNHALDRLAESEPRQAKIVEMRYFGGMSEEEIATYLDISPRTVKRDWALARATLYGELTRETPRKR